MTSKCVLWVTICCIILTACGDNGSASDENGSGNEEAPRPCQTDENCDTGDPCRIGVCNPATRICAFTAFDGDEDGHQPIVCGGDDCNDADSSVHPAAREIPNNGHDENCNGQVDEQNGESEGDFCATHPDAPVCQTNEEENPACNTNESCNIPFCGTWNWRYTDIAYEEGMGNASWIPELRQLLLQNGQRPIRQNGCALDSICATLNPGASQNFCNAKVEPAPCGFMYEEGVWFGDAQSLVFCTGALNEALTEISGDCDGDHGIAAGSAVPYRARVTITKR